MKGKPLSVSLPQEAEQQREGSNANVKDVSPFLPRFRNLALPRLLWRTSDGGFSNQEVGGVSRQKIPVTVEFSPLSDVTETLKGSKRNLCVCRQDSRFIKMMACIIAIAEVPSIVAAPSTEWGWFRSLDDWFVGRETERTAINIRAIRASGEKTERAEGPRRAFHRLPRTAPPHHHHHHGTGIRRSISSVQNTPAVITAHRSCLFD